MGRVILLGNRLYEIKQLSYTLFRYGTKVEGQRIRIMLKKPYQSLAWQKGTYQMFLCENIHELPVIHRVGIEWPGQGR